MLQRWGSLPVLLLGLLVPSLTSAQSFENTAIVRTVELGGSLVHVTTTYAVKALSPGSKVYTLALGAEEKEKTSWLEVKLKGQETPLVVADRGIDASSNYHLLDVTLPTALAVNGSVNIVLETVQTHATWPWPEKAAQQDAQALKYTTDLFVLSPYYTSVQRTKIRSPSTKVISYTTPEGLQDFTLENTVTKSGATITYGPYSKVPASAQDVFITKNQIPITVHYNYDYPVLEVLQLKRAAEISHWGANLNIQDEIHLHNAGPELKGHFSRVEHQSQAFFKRPAPHVMPSLTLHLPPGISNTYYYDLIGNVSTSRLRTVPSPPRSSSSKINANQYSVLELKPRYPLMGGWNYSFTLGWDAPLADSASYDAKTGTYYVGIPIMTLIPGAVVDEAEVKIILPEGATDVEFFPPFPAVSNWISTHTTYLDTTGRPALTFKYEQLTDKHASIIYVSYKVPLSAHLKKPFAVAAAFFSVFTFALAARRIDMRIHTKSKKA